MPGNPQQRASRNRRQTSVTDPTRVNVLYPAVQSLVGNDMRLQLRAQSFPPTVSSAPLPLILSGIPQILRALDSSYPILAVLDVDPTIVTITYGGSGFTTSEEFWIGNQDPAIRTAYGGWMAPGPLYSLTAPAPRAAFTAVRTGAHTVALTGVGTTFASICFNPSVIEELTIAEFPTSFTIAAGILTLTFAGAVTVGDGLGYSGADAWLTYPSTKGLTHDVIVIT